MAKRKDLQIVENQRSIELPKTKFLVIQTAEENKKGQMRSIHFKRIQRN